MKRSIGVTMVAMLLILQGLFSCGSLVLPKLAELKGQLRSAHVHALLMNGAEEKSLANTRANEPTPLEQVESQMVLRRMLRDIWKFMLYVAAVVGGIGILYIRHWARMLVLWQTGLLFLNNSWLYGQLFVLFSHETITGPLKPELRQSWQLHAVSMIGISLTWAAFYRWFFMRPAVKAQFVRQGEQGQMGKDGHG